MSKPTIVLVHGAFGDASSWRGVFDLLDGGQATVLAAALPLRGIAADVPDDDATFMARAQRPLLASAFEEPAAAAAWRTKPSWGVFGTGDQPITPQLHRFSFDRAGSTVTEVEGASHFVMVSNPEVVAGVIRDAVTSSAANLVA